MSLFGPYSTAYLIAMALASWSVRDRPALIRAMLVVAAEWAFLRSWHDLTGDRATVGMHLAADFAAVYALIRWVPDTTQARRAEQCFRAMLLLHVAWAMMLAQGKPVFDRFAYLSLYNGLGYLAMAFIAGGALKDEVIGLFKRGRCRFRAAPAFRQSVYSEE